MNLLIFRRQTADLFSHKIAESAGLIKKIIICNISSKIFYSGALKRAVSRARNFRIILNQVGNIIVNHLNFCFVNKICLNEAFPGYPALLAQGF